MSWEALAAVVAWALMYIVIRGTMRDGWENSPAENRARRPNRPKPPQPEPPQGGTREITERERERLRPPQGGAENRGKEDKA